MMLPLFDAEPCHALQIWRCCLPCRFGQRSTWDRPVKALGWYGPHHCWWCMTWSGK